MRAITLHQPWASLIALGHKTTETRSWPAPKTLVGSRIAIHAAKRRSRRNKWNDRVVEAMACVDLPLGVIVATARVDGCVRVLSNGFARLSEPADPGKVWVVDRFGQEHKDAHRMNSSLRGLLRGTLDMAAVSRQAGRTTHRGKGQPGSLDTAAPGPGKVGSFPPPRMN